jgi:hypothetical protein
MAGEIFSPSQVCVGGNSRKSSETMSGFMGTSMERKDNKRMDIPFLFFVYADLRRPPWMR